MCNSRKVTIISHSVIIISHSASHCISVDNVWVMVIVWREYYQNCSVLDYVTMFTISSTLIWAVLTGPTDWVCHIGTLTLCIEAVAKSCIIVTWWSGSGGIQAWSLMTNWFPSVLWHCWFGHLACKTHPRNHIIMRLRSVCPSLSGKNGLRNENEKGMTGCGSGMRLSWRGWLRGVRGRERGRRKKMLFGSAIEPILPKF